MARHTQLAASARAVSARPELGDDAVRHEVELGRVDAARGERALEASRQARDGRRVTIEPEFEALEPPYRRRPVLHGTDGGQRLRPQVAQLEHPRQASKPGDQPGPDRAEELRRRPDGDVEPLPAARPATLRRARTTGS